MKEAVVELSPWFMAGNNMKSIILATQQRWHVNFADAFILE